MAVYEGKAKRDGVPVPVQYILMKQNHLSPEHRLHYHEYAELLFGISGSASVDVGTERLTLLPGSMIIIYNGEPHNVLFSGEKCKYHVVKFLPQILVAGEQAYSEYSYVLSLMEHIPSRQRFFAPETLSESEIPRLFEHLKEEWDAHAFGYELSLRSDVTRIFLYILRRWREENLALMEYALHSSQRNLIHKALSVIHENYADINEAQAAALCGVSAPYLSRCFKKAMRISFSVYLNNVRLQEAEHLLLTTDTSVTDIAQSVGFSTSAYFIACFRARHGSTPYQYRKLHRGEQSAVKL